MAKNYKSSISSWERGGHGEDWFGRSKENKWTSTHNTGPRLSWDWGRKNSFSSFFAPDLNKQKLIKDSMRHVCDIRDILEVPKKVSIKLHKCDCSCTDGKSVHISTKVFDDKDLESNQKLDIFIGTSIHEFGHILHTDIPLAINKSQEYTKKKLDPNSFEYQLFNIVEDERIESKITQVYPGYANFIGESKYYYYDLLYIKNSSKDDVMQVLQAILHIIRYPSKLDKEVYKKHKVLFKKIREVLSDLGTDSGDAVIKAQKIWQLIVDYFKLPPPPEDENSDGEGDEGDGEDEKEGENSGKGGEGSERNSGKDSKSDSKNNPDPEKASDKDKQPKSGSDEGSAGKEIKPRTEEEVRKIADSLKSKFAILSDSTGNQVSNEIGERELVGKMFTDEYKEIGKQVFKMKIDDNENGYKEERDSIKRHIPLLVNTFSKFFVEQQFALTGLKRGKLDTNKIAEAYQNIETVYKKLFKRTTPGLDVCVLIDESGSMGWNYKIDKARKCAILLNEVFKKVPKCNFYVYGHTADNPNDYETYINVYKDNWNTRPFALGNIKAKGNNRDHVAIKEVHKMVRDQTKAPLLMFVISDGSPAAKGIGGEGEKLVKKVVDEIESKGDTIICQIAIESGIPSKEMFNHYITMINMHTFHQDLSKYVINTLISKLKRVDI